MHDKEAIRMMERCAEEIAMLRRRIEALEPKADAYESIGAILRLLPKPSQGYGEDIVWRLRKAIDELRANEVVVDPNGPENPAAKDGD